MASHARPPITRTRRLQTASTATLASEPPIGGLTVQETAERTGLSEHTLRYYERAGLLAGVRRDGSSGHRRYSADDVSRLSTLACLRATGMPLDQMRRYFTLAARGRSAASSLGALLEEQERALKEHIQETQRHLDYVRKKIDYWRAMDAGRDAEARKIVEELGRGVALPAPRGDAS